MDNWLTKVQVAKILNVSMPTLERLMKAKKIAYYKSGESRTCKVLFRQEDVTKYLKSIKK